MTILILVSIVVIALIAVSMISKKETDNSFFNERILDRGDNIYAEVFSDSEYHYIVIRNVSPTTPQSDIVNGICEKYSAQPWDVAFLNREEFRQATARH